MSYHSFFALLAGLLATLLSAQVRAQVQTHRDDRLGFEISYPETWSKASAPGNPPFFIKRNSPSVIGTLSVDVRNFTGNRDTFMSQLRTDAPQFVAGMRQRFPDAEILEHGDTYLGSFPAYFISTTYTLRNVGTELAVVAFQVFCIRGSRIYLVIFETSTPAFEQVFPEYKAIMATFNFR